jgi:diguanylate cyclase (GGDEF)-like protein
VTARAPDIALRAAPYAGAVLVAFVVVPGTPRLGSLAAALWLTAAFVLLLPLSQRSGRWLRMAPVLAFLLAVFFFKAAEGSLSTGVTALILLPVLWVALYGSRRELAVTVLGVAAYFMLPVVLVSGPDYPASGSPRGLMVAAVAGSAGLLVQRLIHRIRAQAREAVQRECDLALLLGLLREIGDADDVRVAVCDAARTLSRGRSCVLLERDADGRFVVAAATGASTDDLVLGAEEARRVSQVIAARQGATLSDAGAVTPVLAAALGGVDHVAIEPVVGAGVVAALVVGWREPPEERGDVLALLAVEAASVIARADLLVDLKTLALRDPLTGLPNRRAWDDALSRALAAAHRSGERLSVALVDIDTFKQFNDVHGHQAGDRLLKQAAATWQRELREGDVLARWGGDEFAVLLAGQSITEAQSVVERLLRALPEHAFSAGTAEYTAGDDTHRLLERADAQLYAAKAARQEEQLES